MIIGWWVVCLGGRAIITASTAIAAIILPSL